MISTGTLLPLTFTLSFRQSHYGRTCAYRRSDQSAGLSSSIGTRCIKGYTPVMDLLPFLRRYYCYAVLHNPTYREKYAQNLKREFPRIPFYADFWQ
jgi:hypothetical protein